MNFGNIRFSVRRRALLAAAVLLAGGCTPAPSAPPVAPEAKRIRVVSTNDFHGHLLPSQPSWAGGRTVGGAAVLAAHFDSAAARFTGPTFLLDGGDVMQGTAISNLSWGRATIEAFNAAGYDAAALGNHEFDWGIDTLRARIGESRFAWLGANIYRENTREQPEWARSWVMLERGGVRVAIVGAALSTTPRIVLAGRLQGLAFGAEAPGIDAAVREARAAGADFVIVTMHVGASCADDGSEAADRSGGCEGKMIEVAEALSERVDLIVGGHTHRRVLSSAAGIPLTESRSYGTAYGITDLEQTDSGTIVLQQQVRTPFGDEVRPDSAVAAIVARWNESVRPVSERIVATFAVAMPRSNAGEYPLGQLLADVQRTATGAHIGIVNNGGIRRGLPAGEISYGMLFELQPFQNELVAVRADGSVLRQVLEAALGSNGRPGLQISGVTVRYDPSAPEGQRVREMRLWDGREIGPETPVTIGTSEFVATGGDGFEMLDAEDMTRTGLVDLDALVTYLEALPQPVQLPEHPQRWVPVKSR